MGLIEDVEGAEKQLEEGYLKGDEVDLKDLEIRRGITVVGIGGSAIAGELLKGLLNGVLDVEVVRGPEVHVRRDRLYFIVSYSGNTWETLMGFKALVKTGIRNIVALTSGGMLGKAATTMGLPWIQLTKGRQPRADLYEQIVAMLRIVERLGIHLKLREALEETVKIFNFRKTRRGFIAEMAAELNGRSGVIYGYGYLSPAALRWKQQFNENSKILAWAEEVPEAMHNSLVGWDGYPDPDQYVVILLRDPSSEPEPVKEELNWFENFLDKKDIIRFSVIAEGEKKISKLLGIVYMGDLISVELAMIRGLDPEAIEVITILKRHMSEWGISKLLEL